MRYIIILIVMAVFSCRPNEDHGHSHEEEGGHAHAHEGRPSEDHTVWTDRSELFVEFPALVVGETSRFAAHFTVLEGHQPVREGSVTVSLIQGKKGVRHTVDAPSSPGIFTPALQPTGAGMYQLVFALKSEGLTDRIVLDEVRVFATSEEAEEHLADETEESNVIPFLKEQAWKTEFQTAPVVKKQVYQTIPTSGVWKSAPSGSQTVIAPTNGQVTFTRDLTEGRAVKKGEPLMTVSSAGLTANNLGSEVQKARAVFDQAKAEYERKKELFESKIVPRADFEQVEQKYLVAKTNYETLSRGYATGGKRIVSPSDGHIKSVHTTNGGFADQGDALVTVVSHYSSLLEVRVSPAYGLGPENIRDLFYRPTPDAWSGLKEKGGKIISVTKKVDAERPLVSVFAEVNESVNMPEGSFTEALLAVGEPLEGLVAPTSSLLEDYGSYSVIVQLSGETFQRRNVVIGQRNGNEVEIIKGLGPGEVVVSKGAYQVKMASMTGQAPDHGHAH